MLLNVSNHPVSAWPPAQRTAAEAAFGSVVDVPFPAVPPQAEGAEVARLADELAAVCRERLAAAVGEAHAVHAMGETTLVAVLIARLQRVGLRCVVSTRARPLSPGDLFVFVRFRDVPSLCP